MTKDNSAPKYFLVVWEITRKNWNSLSKLNRLRLKILFKVILPSSKLRITDGNEVVKERSNS